MNLTDKRQFSFGIWGDPQVAYWEAGTKFDDHNNKRKWENVNPRLRENVQLCNRLAPEFVVTLGDNVHGIGEWEHYEVFIDIAKGLNMPIFSIMGNHEHCEAAEAFASNPRGFTEFGNFLEMQKQLGAPEAANYSFDAGDWHFICFSEPGVDEHVYGPGISHYTMREDFLGWLAKDLAANKDKPTMFFTHHPVLPAGHISFDFYGTDAHARKAVTDVLTRYGNVKYAFFGHVHNTVASVEHISWHYQGTNFIIMPNAANWIRPFNFPESYQSSYGVGVVHLDGPTCTGITFHTLAGETVDIDCTKFETYDDNVYGYLTPPGHWAGGSQIKNGDFSNPLLGSWYQAHNPQYLTTPTRETQIQDGRLHLKVATNDGNPKGVKNYSFVQQALDFDAETFPMLSLEAHVPNPVSQRGGGFIGVQGFAKDQSTSSLFMLVYVLGDFPAERLALEFRSIDHTAILSTPAPVSGKGFALNVRQDLAYALPHLTWADLQANRLVVTLGAAAFGSADAGPGISSEALFSNICLADSDPMAGSSEGFALVTRTGNLIPVS